MSVQVGLWQPASNGTALCHWFLFRDNVDGFRDYYMTATDNLIRYASYETAQRAADKLNAAESS